MSGVPGRPEYVETRTDGLVGLTVTSKRVGVAIFAPSGLVGDAFARVFSIAGFDARAVDASSRRLPEGWWRDVETVVVFEALLDALPAQLRSGAPNTPFLVVIDSNRSHPKAVALDSTCDSLIEEVASCSANVHRTPRLTRRHREILQLVANGHTTDEAAEQLGITAKTVNNHLGAVYKRLGARNLTRAVLIAARAGIINVTVSSVFPDPNP